MWPVNSDNLLMSCVGWLPSSLAKAAERNTNVSSFVLGVMACALITVSLPSAEVGAISEPYRDLGEYVYHTLMAAPFVFVALLVVCAAFYALLAFHPIGNSARGKRMLRILFLSPTTVLIPGLIWSVFAALHSYAHPHNGFSGPGGKPAWLTSLPIVMLGSPLWILVLVALVIANAKVALKQLDAALDGAPQCANCGYNLTGLPEPRCPECGQPFEPNGDAT